MGALVSKAVRKKKRPQKSTDSKNFDEYNSVDLYNYWSTEYLKVNKEKYNGNVFRGIELNYLNELLDCYSVYDILYTMHLSLEHFRDKYIEHFYEKFSIYLPYSDKCSKYYFLIDILGFGKEELKDDILLLYILNSKIPTSKTAIKIDELLLKMDDFLVVEGFLE